MAYGNLRDIELTEAHNGSEIWARYKTFSSSDILSSWRPTWPTASNKSRGQLRGIELTIAFDRGREKAEAQSVRSLVLTYINYNHSFSLSFHA